MPGTYEIRALGTGKGTVAGYFDDLANARDSGAGLQHRNSGPHHDTCGGRSLLHGKPG
jgi:hypothetical protein